MRKHVPLFILTFAVFLPSAHATYSIVACDSLTRQCGVAVQTNNLAVGSSVPYAQAGVGAIASQFETNPRFGPSGLALLSQGKSPDEILKQILREDGNFDGQGIEARQVGIVALDGRSIFYTGQEAASANWAGGRNGKGYSIQGNGLAGTEVVGAMEQAFLKASGPLANRLMAALVAGDAAGGQKTGRESAALLVRTPEGFPMDVDLRVDHASDPVAELQKLYNMHSARQQVIQAGTSAHKGEFEQARSLMIAAVALAPAWPRIWIRAAKVAENIEEPQLALQYITMAFSQNPAWVQQEIGSGDYAELGASPLFRRWVTSEQEHSALTAFHKLPDAKQITPQDRIEISRLLLEVGHPREALTLLNNVTDPIGVDIQLLRAEAYAASGNYRDAMKQCREAATKAPQDLRVHLRLRELSQHMPAGQEVQ